ncbi:MAG: hypothetical protein PVI97_18610 [Candidatus Thiodiazotropha sp.]
MNNVSANTPQNKVFERRSCHRRGASLTEAMSTSSKPRLVPGGECGAISAKQ